MQVKAEISEMFSNKKKLFYWVLLFLMMRLPLSAQQTSEQTHLFDSLNLLITDALIGVDAQKLSSTFHEKIDLSLSDNQGIYSCLQAHQIIKGFFKKFPVLSYRKISENITNNSNFVVGIMKTQNQQFRVCYLIKMELLKPEIYQFRIEND